MWFVIRKTSSNESNKKHYFLYYYKKLLFDNKSSIQNVALFFLSQFVGDACVL